eukprot:1549300-Pleurochrysis_carterae.AAC.1
MHARPDSRTHARPHSRTHAQALAHVHRLAHARPHPHVRAPCATRHMNIRPLARKAATGSRGMTRLPRNRQSRPVCAAVR